jgi:hypothetical protein
VTVNLSSPRAKPRWLILCLVILGLSAIGAGIAAGHGVTTMPTGYVGSTLEDVHGANDVPGQVDVTIMGRDNAQAPKLRIFWSWDSISAWTGSGQTGDACALFDDADVDAFIDYVVCARVQNLNANPEDPRILPAAANKPVYIFDCSNKKNDRCTNPAPRDYATGQVLAGPLGTPNAAGTGNLLSHLDPFDVNDLNGPGESFPHDTTIDIEIASALVPAGVGLANVCSYPSAGNGGNNNPFDCIVTPGTQYGTLRVVKVLTNNSGGTRGVGDFTFDVSGNVADDVAFDATDNTNDFIVPIGPYSVTENAATGYATTYTNTFNANENCNGIVVSVGAITTCTITNNDKPGSLTLVKRVQNDNGGTATVTDFSLSTTAGSLTFDAGVADGTNIKKYTSNTLSVNAGSYNFSEINVAGYTEGTWSCTGATASGTAFNAGSVTIGLDTAVVCTITNNDDAGSLQLVKRVVNNNGGTATVTTFGLATNAGSLTFDTGTADGTDTTKYTSNAINVAAGAYSLSENNVAGYAEGSWSCPLGTNVTSTFSAGSVTVPNGVAVVCTITNNDDAGSLQLVKRVVNNNGGSATVTDFNLTTSAGALTFDTGVADGADTIKYTSNALTVAAGSYSLIEGNVAGYTEGAWGCTGGTANPTTFSAGSVTVANGATVVCTITNNDDKAVPSGSTAQSYVLHDSLTMSALRLGAPDPGTLTFRLWSTKTGDVCSDQVGTDLGVTNITANATYAPTSGIAVTAADTYYWTVQYSGDQFNAGFTTACGSESTTISKIE